MATMDQAVWANVNVSVGGEHQAFARGELLPEPATAEEASERNLLRLGGALRTVEVVYTAEELADMARQRGEATATREAALDVDPALPAGDQVSGSAATGAPTMMEPSGSPVVIGDEDLRAEHDQQRKEADKRRAALGARPPGASASKAAWVDYAVDHREASRSDAEGMTRDELRREYGDERRTARHLPADQASPNPGASAAALAGAQAQDKAPGQAPEAPTQDADVAEWRDYAASRGADPGKLAAMSRDQLIAAYGPASG